MAPWRAPSRRLGAGVARWREAQDAADNVLRRFGGASSFEFDAIYTLYQPLDVSKLPPGVITATEINDCYNQRC